METRAARREEYQLVREILANAFRTEDEAQLWDYLVAHDTALQPDGVRLALADGRPVACTVVLPRQIRTRQGWVPGAVVTLVACEPAFQGRGFGGSSVRDAVAYMARTGLALGVLYGHPGYYPRFGFAPVLPRWSTTLALPTTEPQASALRQAVDAEVPHLLGLYTQHLADYPCAVARTDDAWLWRPRNGAENSLLVLPDHSAYAFVAVPADEDRLVVMEAAAASPEAGRSLLGSLRAEARQRGKATLELLLPPDHQLVRLARLAGAEQHRRPAAAGMAIVTDWAALLPAGYSLAGTTLTGSGVTLTVPDEQSLTQLVLGYHSLADTLLLPGCRLEAREESAVERLRQDFAARFPRWSLAPFWH